MNCIQAGACLVALLFCHGLAASCAEELLFPKVEKWAPTIQVKTLKVMSHSPGSEIFEGDRNRMMKVEALQREISAFLDEGSLQTVLYPGVGFDVDTPFLAMPSVDTVVGLDLRRFWGSSPVRVEYRPGPMRVAFSQNDSAYEYAEDLPDLLAGAILYRLKMFIPQFRLRQIYAFGFEGDDFSSGAIEFDQGPNSKPRIYVHIHTTLKRSERFSAAHRLIAKIGYDVLFIKASQNLFFDKMPGDGGALGLLSPLRDNGGLIVDNDSRLVDLENKSFVSRANVRETAVNGLGRDVTRIYYFVPKARRDSPQP